MTDAYCVAEKRKVQIQNGRTVRLKNGRTAVKGNDSHGHKVMRIQGGSGASRRTSSPAPRAAPRRMTPRRSSPKRRNFFKF